MDIIFENMCHLIDQNNSFCSIICHILEKNWQRFYELTQEIEPEIKCRFMVAICSRGILRLVKILHKLGFPINLLLESKTPIVHACEKGHLPVVEWLINVGQVNTEERSLCAYFASACHYGHLNIANWLCNKFKNLPIDFKTSKGYTTLMAVCEINQQKSAVWLIERGANVCTTNIDGFDILQIVCYKGHFEIAKLLTENGAEVTLSHLKCAIAKGINTNLCKFLISKLTYESDEVVKSEINDIIKLIKSTNLNEKVLIELWDWTKMEIQKKQLFRINFQQYVSSKPEKRRRISPRRKCFLPLLPPEIIPLIAEFSDVKIKKQLSFLKIFDSIMEESKKYEEEDEKDLSEMESIFNS
jgi:ankyrin repeat protein